MSYNILKGKKGIIFGALNELSIAWKAARRVVEEGAEIVLTNTPVSLRFGEINKLAEETGAIVVPADATNIQDLEALVDKAMEHFGGQFDFVLHSIGMSPNVRKNIPYEATNYDFFNKTLDISAISFHKLLKVLYSKNAIKRGGSIVALTYIAAERATTAGQGIAGMQDMLKFADSVSPLGNALAEDCADYIVMMFSDFTRKVTMQNLYHNGGFSTTNLLQLPKTEE